VGGLRVRVTSATDQPAMLRDETVRAAPYVIDEPGTSITHFLVPGWTASALARYINAEDYRSALLCLQCVGLHVALLIGSGLNSIESWCSRTVDSGKWCRWVWLLTAGLCAVCNSNARLLNERSSLLHQC